MKYTAELESAIDMASAISRYLEDQRLGGEEWTVSIWFRDARFTVWFQIENRVRSKLKQVNSKLANPRLPLDFAYTEVETAFRELRASV